MKTKKAWLAAVLNFFFVGAGYLYNGKRMALGAGLTLGGFGLTYVELGIQPLDTTLYAIMFAAVFLINTLLAVDAYKEAQGINSGELVAG